MRTIEEKNGRKIIIKGRPSMDVIKNCQKKNYYVICKASGRKIEQGFISDSRNYPAGDYPEMSFLFAHQDSDQCIYWQEITSFTYFSPNKSIFIENNAKHGFEDSNEVIVKSGTKSFRVNKQIVSDRSKYFKSVLMDSKKKEGEEEVIDLSFFLSDKELEALLKFLDWNDIAFCNGKELVYLLDGLDKIGNPSSLSQENLLKKILQQITLTEYYELIVEQHHLGQRGKQFINNGREEVKNYCYRQRKVGVPEIVLEELGKEKKLTLGTYNKGWSPIREANVEQIVRVLTLLEIGGLKLENLEICDLSILEMKPIFTVLTNHKSIKSFKANLNSFDEPKSTLKDIEEILLFMKTAPQLEKICFDKIGEEDKGFHYKPQAYKTRNEYFWEGEKGYRFSKDALKRFNCALKQLQERSKNNTIQEELTLSPLLSEKKGCKVSLKSGAKTFTVCKEIINDFSDYFKNLLTSPGEEKDQSVFDLSLLLSERELEILYEMMISNSIAFLSSVEETLYLLDGLAKIVYPNLDELELHLKNNIFKSITLTDYYQLIEKQDHLGPLGKSFLNNMKEEVKNYCERMPSNITKKVLEEFGKGKKLILTHQADCWKDSIWWQDIQLYGNDMARVITLLELSGFKLEHLELWNIPIPETQAVFACLINHKTIKSVTSCGLGVYAKGFLEPPTTSLEDINTLLLFMKSVKQLESVQLGTIAIKEENYQMHWEYKKHPEKIPRKYIFSKEALNAFNLAKEQLQERQKNKISQDKLTFFSSDRASRDAEGTSFVSKMP